MKTQSKESKPGNFLEFTRKIILAIYVSNLGRYLGYPNEVHC